jgi:BASS family bile acid:Na+ symporter
MPRSPDRGNQVDERRQGYLRVGDVTLVQMMVTIGLGVKMTDLAPVARSWGLVTRAAVANYLIVPAAAVGLLLVFGADPMAAAGVLMAAVCPGAPYGPPFTAMARGDVVAAVGLMVVLAASSALLAPLLLRATLPVVAAGQAIQIDALKLVLILAVTQLLPLGVGLWLRRGYPALSDRLKKPFARLSTLLNIALIATIVAVHFRALADIRVAGYLGMVALVIASAGAGWIVGGPGRDARKTLAVTTSMRNVGVSLVIASSSLPGTLAVTAATAYALVQTVTMVAVVTAWGRRATPGASLRAA